MRLLPLYPAPPRLAVEIAAPLTRDPGCTRCALGARAHTVCMPAELTGAQVGPRLLVVGEAPGEAEDYKGRPFVGAAGSLLRAVLTKHWPGSVVLASALGCYPGAAKLTDKHLDACRGYLAQTLADAAPVRIVALGAKAIKAVTGDGYQPFSTRRGYAYLADRPVPVFLAIHPAVALCNRFVRAWFEADLAWALTCPDPLPPPVGGMVLRAETADDARQLVARLRATGLPVAFDVETFGTLHESTLRVLDLGLGAGDVVAGFGEELLYDPEASAPVRALLADPRVGKVSQNGKFDAQVILQALATPIRGRELDTRLLRKLQQADASAKLVDMQPLVGMAGGKSDVAAALAGIKHGLSRYCAARRKAAKDGKPFAAPMPPGWRADDLAVAVAGVERGDKPGRYLYAALEPDLRASYNGRDVVSTGLLAAHLSALATPAQHRVYDRVVRAANVAIQRMERTGIAVSRPAIYQLQAAMRARETLAAAKLAAVGLDNPGSTPQVVRLLFDVLKLPHTKATKTGFSTDAASLEGLDHPVAADLREWRKVSKFRAQYADAMLGFVRDDGRVHPEILLDGAESGRPSCRNPNIFNIPRPKTDEGKMARNVFVARPGHVLLELDYNQQELRTAAFMSGDPVMLDIFARNIDFHLATAKLIAPVLHIDPETVGKDSPLRDQAKISNFAVLYDFAESAAKRLAAVLKVSVHKAGDIIGAILGKFKRLAAWIAERLIYTRRTGLAHTWWDGEIGRTRPLWAVGDAAMGSRLTAERSAWNTPVQGTAAEFMNASLGAVAEWIAEDEPPAALVLTVYDSMLLEVREDALPEVAWQCKRIMESWPSGDVRLQADAKTGYAWGAMSDYAVPA